MRKLCFVLAISALALSPAAFAEDERPFGACAVLKDVEKAIGNLKLAPQNQSVSDARNALDDVRLYLTDLCDDQPTREQFVNGEAADWLTRADTVENTLYALATAPLSNPTRSELSRKNFLSVYALRLDSRLAELRSIAYRAVRVETREVIREVPADCPEARSPEPDRSCNPALKASTRRWFNTLESMTNHVSRSNGAFTVANDLKEEMRGVVWSNDSSDVLSLAVSWERRLSDALDDKTNHEGWFPLSNSERQRFESILTDMRTQLRFCGLHNRRF